MGTAHEGITVQLTCLNECNGLRIIEKNANHFTVKELQGGTSNIMFDYLVQGTCKGYDTLNVIEKK